MQRLPRLVVRHEGVLVFLVRVLLGKVDRVLPQHRLLTSLPMLSDMPDRGKLGGLSAAVFLAAAK